MGGRQRARKGTGTIWERGDRFVAQIDFGVGTDGKRNRRAKTFARRHEAEAWLRTQRGLQDAATGSIAGVTVAEYLRWWLEHEAPKGKPGRAPLAETTLQGYRVNIEKHLIPVLGERRLMDLTVAELDRFASAKLDEGYAPATVNRMRQTLRSALSTAVRQDRLSRNVARYGGGVGNPTPPVDWFTADELRRILKEAADEHYFPIILLLARTGLRIGEACGLRWRDVRLSDPRPRLSVVWQLDKWMNIVRPKSDAARRTVPLRSEVVDELSAWSDRQCQWRDNLGDEWADGPDLVFTTRAGRPVSKRNVYRSFKRCLKRVGIEHGSLKTLRSTVATQLAEAGVHPRKVQAFLGHAQMSTTMRYYTAVGDLGEVADMLPEL